MALADRDLIDADRLGPRPARAGELGFHVLLLQRLDRIPVELQLLGNVLDRRLPTALAHVMGKPLRIERVVRQEIEPLALHLAATAASHPPDLNLQEDARVAARQIANLPYTPVVPTRMNSPAAPSRLSHNLTLTGYNSELSNGPFEAKRQLLEDSHFE